MTVAINKNATSFNIEVSQSKVKVPIHYKCFAKVWRQFTLFNLQSRQIVDCILNSYWIIYMQVTRFVVCAGFNAIMKVPSEKDKSRKYIPFW